MPFFSILMPSRNRAQLLKTSIQTVLSQSFQDYELLVSDNNSRDDTKQVVQDAQAANGKVQYLNPGRDLSMCDNFEFALNHARGDYILFLSDDDALVDGMLAYIHDVLAAVRSLDGTPIEVLTWQRSRYIHPDMKEAGDPNNMFLAFRQRSGRLYEVASRLILDMLCDFDNAHPNYHFAAPKVVNCAIARPAFERCIQKTGRFFVPPFPDYSTICQLLCTHPAYHLIDMPLYVCGSSIAANSAIGYQRVEKMKSFLALFKPGEISLEQVPYPMPYLIASYMLATYLKFQQIYPDTFKSKINLDNYLMSLADELIGYERGGADVADEMAIFTGYVRQHFGDDQMLQRYRSNTTSGLNKGRMMAYLRDLAASNDLTRNLASTMMRLLKVGRPDARQYNKVSSIVQASQLVARDLKLSTRSAATLRPVPIATPAELTLLS